MHSAAAAHSLARAWPRAVPHCRPAAEGILAQLPSRQGHALRRGKSTLSAEGASMLRGAATSAAQVSPTEG